MCAVSHSYKYIFKIFVADFAKMIISHDSVYTQIKNGDDKRRQKIEKKAINKRDSIYKHKLFRITKYLNKNSMKEKLHHSLFVETMIHHSLNSHQLLLGYLQPEQVELVHLDLI